jgi:hypothetical protein
VDGIPFAPFTAASAFTVDAPSWEPTATEEPVSGGISLTTFVSPDENMNAQVLQAPEEPPSVAASRAREARDADGATGITDEPTTIAGREGEAYLLRFIHDEPKATWLPDMGEVYVSTCFFNDSGSSWRTRAAVETTVPDGEKLALDIATEMAETLEPKP